MRGLPAHLPQAVVGVEIAVVETQLAQAVAQEHEMARLVVGHLRPVAVEALGQAAEAVDRVPAQVDGVEFDVGDRMQERGPALVAAQAAPGQLARMHQPRPRRPSRHADRRRRRRVRRDVQFAAGEGGRMAVGERDLLAGIGGGKALGRGFEQGGHGISAVSVF